MSWRLRASQCGGPCFGLWGQTSAEALTVTEWLIALGANAVSILRRPRPLLPARYHFFFRGLQGASVCISPECRERAAHSNTFWSHLVLDEQPDCPVVRSWSVSASDLLSLWHSVSACTVVDGRWQGIVPGSGADVHVLTWNRDTKTRTRIARVERLEARLTSQFVRILSQESKSVDNLSFFCCEHPLRRELRVVVTPKADGLVTRCPICGGRGQPFPTVSGICHW